MDELDEETQLALALSASEADEAERARSARAANSPDRGGASSGGREAAELAARARSQVEEAAREARRQAERAAEREAFLREQREQYERLQRESRGARRAVRPPSPPRGPGPEEDDGVPPTPPPSGGAGQAQASVAFVTCCLREDEEVADGYYEMWGFDEDALGSSRLPTLGALERMRSEGLADGREVVYVDRGRDAALCALVELVGDELAAYEGVSEAQRAAALAVIVANQMDSASPRRRAASARFDNPTEAAQAERRWRHAAQALQVDRRSLAIPLGDITEAGLPRHRALLFKLLAPAAGLKVRLVRGAFYCGDESTAKALVMIGDEPHEVDLVDRVGALKGPNAADNGRGGLDSAFDGAFAGKGHAGPPPDQTSAVAAEERLLRQLESMGALMETLSADQALRALRLAGNNASRALMACQVMDVSGVGALDALAWLDTCGWDVEATVEAFFDGRLVIAEPQAAAEGSAAAASAAFSGGHAAFGAAAAEADAREAQERQERARASAAAAAARHEAEVRRGKAEAAAAAARARARATSEARSTYTRWEDMYGEEDSDDDDDDDDEEEWEFQRQQEEERQRHMEEAQEQLRREQEERRRREEQRRQQQAQQERARRQDQSEGPRHRPPTAQEEREQAAAERAAERQRQSTAAADAAAAEAAARDDARAVAAERLAQAVEGLDLADTLAEFGFAPAGTSAAQVRTAYRKAVMRLHPDRTRSLPLDKQVEAEEKFKLLQTKLQENSG